MNGNWLHNLFMGQGVAHTVLILAVVITFGILLGRVKVKGIGLGTTWVLFVGIILSHFGMRIDAPTLGFVKEFGLILFVYAIGLSVGPNFFSSFRKGGLMLNVWATCIVMLACLCAYIIHRVTGTSLITMVGVMQGAVTNTPGLGAAQQTVADALAAGAVPDGMSAGELERLGSSLGLGYAAAYPLGVVGIILSILLIKLFFRINMASEEKKLEDESSAAIASPEAVSVEITAESEIAGLNILGIHAICTHNFIISRVVKRGGKVEIPSSRTILDAGDRVRLITSKHDVDKVVPIFGKKVEGMNAEVWNRLDKHLGLKRIIVTKNSVNGKTIRALNVRHDYGVSITRIIRSGIEIVPKPNTELFVGDTLVAVGNPQGIDKFATLIGNSTKKLYQPKLASIFFGIALGVLLGSLPIYFPGMPHAVKLGLAGGPLIVAILISYFGHKVHIGSYTTQSANMMLSELGITMFLASVGLSAGENFVDTLVSGGYRYVFYGVIITMVPLLLIGILARIISKTNYLTLMGVLAGSTTDPPALAFASNSASNSYPAIGYATVYPLSMFLRVLMAQILVLIALG